MTAPLACTVAGAGLGDGHVRAGRAGVDARVVVAVVAVCPADPPVEPNARLPVVVMPCAPDGTVCADGALEVKHPAATAATTRTVRVGCTGLGGPCVATTSAVGVQRRTPASEPDWRDHVDGPARATTSAAVVLRRVVGGRAVGRDRAGAADGGGPDEDATAPGGTAEFGAAKLFPVPAPPPPPRKTRAEVAGTATPP